MEPQFQVMNPLMNVISEAEQIIAQLDSASEELEACIADERTWFSRLREAQDAYDSLENEIVADVVIAAQIKEGPLAGIPVSGKGYDLVLTNIKNQARNGDLKEQWKMLNERRHSYEAAQIDLMRAEARFKAMRTIAEVKTQVLRASTI